MSKMRITHVQAVGPFLRIFGQQDVEMHRKIQGAIDAVIAYMNQTKRLAIPSLSELPVDTICLAHFKNQFNRARVIGYRNDKDVFCQFIDFGNECNVRVQDIRLLNFQCPEVEAIKTLPTQALPFMLTGIWGEWDTTQINILNEELSGENVFATQNVACGTFIFITIQWRSKNLVQHIVETKGFGNYISLEQQTSTFHGILSKSTQKVLRKTTSTTENSTNNNDCHSIKARSRGLIAVRQLHSTPAPPMNMMAHISQPMLPPHIMPGSEVPMRMPYKHKGLTSPTSRHLAAAGLNVSPPKPTVQTFKSNTLMVGKFYDVYCCFVENGPCLFSVHLKSTTAALAEMMNEIENIPLPNLRDRPSIGMACIARYSEDNTLYRAVIMTIKPTACQVAYVDYGNTEFVPFADLYEIPTHLLEQKIFAIRFALSSYKDLEPLDDMLKNAFKDMVLHKDLRLKVMPLEGPPLVQYCELYDGNVNVLEALKNYTKRKLTYLVPPPLQNNEMVLIRFVESPKKFFVQKVDSIRAFDQMMDDLFLHCKKMHTPLNKFAKGSACAVKFENAWYRAEIISVNQNRVLIRHVDFGNERHVDAGQLCAITERLVKFPVQAIKCCLKGFENTSTLSESATIQLEMLAENENNERRHFKCQIYQEENDGTVLVNLIDDRMRPELNMMKKLYKLSMPFNKYIGLEKEEYPYQQKPQTNFTQLPQVHVEESVSSTTQQVSNDWEVRSSHSAASNDSKDRSTPPDFRNQNNRRQNQQSPQQYPDNNGRRDYKDQHPTTTFKGRNAKLPPRFQKQQDENRQMQNNNNRPNSNGYDQQPRNNSYENKSRNSSYNHNMQSNNNQHLQATESNDDWETEPIQRKSSVSPVSNPKSTGTSFLSSLEDYVPLNFTYLRSDVPVPSREPILLCWWISPHQFYTHNCSNVPQFETLMRDIQSFYKNKPAVTNRTIDVGSSIVARYQKDRVLYRATVLAHNAQLKKYRVEFVDFGNQATITTDDIWLLERRFAQFPIMAQLCGFENVVSNLEHRQITSQVEKYLTPNLKLLANYLRREKNMYYADIDVGGKSLRELLIQDGSLSSVEPNLNLELLAGQQISIKIVSITDLLNFQIEIEGCDLKLISSYNDIKFVKSNPHLSREFKSTYEGKTCVADVINVSKEKILMLQPIIPLFNSEISQKICDYPVVYRDINMKIAYIETENIIYAQPVAVEGKIAELLDSMYNFYNEQGRPPPQYTPGTICAALSADGNWYRAKIIYCDTSNYSTEVYYIDYGNTEYIENKDHIRELEKHFYESSALAVRFYFPIKSGKTDTTAVDTIKTLTDGYELTLSIVNRYKSCWIGDIQSNGHSLIYVLKDNYSLANGMDIEHAKNIIDNDSFRDLPQSPITPAVKSPAYSTEETASTTISNSSSSAIPSSDSGIIVSDRSEGATPDVPGDMIPAYLSHCDNPGRFFLHLTSTYPELQQLQDNIQIVAGSLPPLMTYVTGALCIALYTVDDTWYRAKIIDSEIMAVQFIDYGNTDVLTDNSFVKEMNEAFAKVPPYAISCALPISPRNTVDWVDEANNIFNEAYDKTVYFSYITQNPKKNYVNLKIDGLSVADKLIADGLARKLEVLKSGENGFVSHINSLSDFYIQMESYADGLELVAGHLADYENFKVLSDFSVGNVCAAVFPDDNSWYRAKILSHSSQGTEVLFIDYGNAAITTELREISADIANLPFLSKKCSLRMPDHILSWSDQAEALFHVLSAMGETVFRVELIEPADHAIIDLYIGDRNILEDLEPLCDRRPNIEMDLSSSMGKDDFAMHESVCEPKWEEVTVSYANSPKDFYIHLSSDQDKLDQMLERLNSEELGSPLERPSVGTICNALFNDDGAYYRAEVLANDNPEGCKVLFIDYGNDAVSGNLYSLPTGLNTIPPLAHGCTLEPNGPLNLTSPFVVEKFNEMINGSESFKVDVVNRSTKPWVVSLQCNGLDAYAELEKHQPESEEETICEPKTQEVINVTVSYVNSPTDFYVHLESESEKLQEMLDRLNSEELGSALVKPAVGTICNALFNDDGAYYRAQVLSNTDPNSSEVLFIDYGNTEISDQLFALPADCAKIPPLAYKCSLSTSGALDLASKEMLESFNNLINESTETKITIVSRAPKLWTVTVSCNGKDLYDELMKLHPQPTASSIIQPDDTKSFVRGIVSEIVESAEKESNLVPSLVDEMVNLAIDGATIQNGPTHVSDVTISHVNSPCDFYIQLPCDEADLQETVQYTNSEQLDDMFPYCEVGKIYNALFIDDSGMYLYHRAKLLTYDGTNGCEVLFIDFGHTAVTHDLRYISPYWCARPALAYKCTLDSKSSLDLKSPSVVEKFHQIVKNGQDFDIDIIDSSAKPWTVSLKCDGADVYEMLKNHAATAAGGESHLSPIKQIVNELIDDSVTKSTTERQLNLEMIKNIVNEIVNKSLDVLLKASQEKCDTTDDIVKDIVNNVVEECLDRLLKPSDTPEDFDETTQFVRGIIESTIDTSISAMRETSDVSDFDETAMFVRGIVESAVDSSILASLKTNDALQKSGPVDVIITKVCNIRDFWVKLCSEESNQKSIDDSLKDGAKYEKMQNIQPLQLCAALNPTTGSYCRAKMVSSSANGEYNVELIDSGSRITTKQVRKLPTELEKIPPLAKHCALSSRDSISVETEMFKKHFESNSNRVYQMKVVEQCDNMLIVTLSSNGSALQEELAALSIVHEAIDASLSDLMKDVIISHANDANDFYVQFVSESKNLETISESLSGAVKFDKVTSPHVGLLCAALFPDDGAFYRAKILSMAEDKSSYEVLFIDFGNISTTNDIRLLPADIEKKESIAKCCALENTSEIDLWSDMSRNVFNGLVQARLGETFQVEIRSEISHSPLIVRLFYQSTDIYDELRKQMCEEQESNNSSDIWKEAKDSTGAIISEEIVETIIDNALRPCANGSIGGENNSRTSDDHFNDTATTTTSASSDVPNDSGYTVEQFAEELWYGLKKLGLEDSNRASSTSNLCDTQNSVTSLLLEQQNDPTRSKSVDCVSDDKH